MDSTYKITIVVVLLIAVMFFLPLIFGNREGMTTDPEESDSIDIGKIAQDATTKAIEDMLGETDEGSEVADSPKYDGASGHRKENTSSHDTMMTMLTDIKSGIATIADSDNSEKKKMVTDKCNVELSDEEAKCYLNRYIDVQEMFGKDNIEKAKEHWRTSGCMNKRKIGCTTDDSTMSCPGTTKNVPSDANQVVYKSSDGKTLNVYSGPNGKVIESSDGTKYVIKSQDVKDTDVEKTEADISKNELSANTTLRKFTSSTGEVMYAVTRKNGSVLIINENGDVLKLDTSYDNPYEVDKIRMYEQDKYILKTQVVPPVCPTCPGIAPSVYGDDSSTTESTDTNDTSTSTAETTDNTNGSSTSTTETNSENTNGTSTSTTDDSSDNTNGSSTSTTNSSSDNTNGSSNTNSTVTESGSTTQNGTSSIDQNLQNVGMIGQDFVEGSNNSFESGNDPLPMLANFSRF